MNKRIMFFIGSLSWGGAEKIITVLANQYLENGYEVTIVTLLSNKNVFDLDKRINLISIARENKKNIFNVYYWIKNIRKLVEQSKPDVVVSFVCRINVLVIKALMRCKHKCRLVISERNDPRFDTRGFLGRFFSKRLYPHADLLICQTSAEKEWFNKKIQSKTVVVPNPIFLTSMPIKFEAKKNIIINAARFDESKNQKMLIDAYHNLVVCKKDNGYKLHLYGNGILKEQLIDQISRLGIKDKVYIFDSVADIQDKISEASVFCLTSKYEGMSNALMEALLLGTPSISTDTSGARDLIEDEKNGFVVDVNDLNTLTKKLELLINSDDIRKNMYEYCLSEKYQTKFAISLKKYIEYIDGKQ